MPDLKPVPYFVIEVKDTGHGIPRGVIDRIFDPFFTTKRPGEGTGMGLAVVHGIVKSLNGAIAVASTPGIGSVFTVYLPIVVSAKQQSLPREGSDPPGGKEHILFVDDEPAIVEMNSMILKRLGYKVTAATSSVEALALFTHTPQVFDLVITDVTMPELTGAELAKRLRAIRSDIPIILVTGFSETVNAENARRDGHRQDVDEAPGEEGTHRGHTEGAGLTQEGSVEDDASGRGRDSPLPDVCDYLILCLRPSLTKVIAV